MKQMWNCKQMFSNRNRPLRNMFQRKLESIKSLKSRTMTSLIMMLKSNQSSMYFSAKQLTKLALKSRKNLSLMKSGSLSTTTQKEDSLKNKIGNKKSNVKSQELRSKTRHLRMQEWRESNKLKLWISFNAWILLKASFKTISNQACSS